MFRKREKARHAVPSIPCAPASRFPSRNFPCIVGRTRPEYAAGCCSRRLALKMQMSPQPRSTSFVGRISGNDRERGEGTVVEIWIDIIMQKWGRSDPTAAVLRAARGGEMHNVQGCLCDGPSSRHTARPPRASSPICRTNVGGYRQNRLA